MLIILMLKVVKTIWMKGEGHRINLFAIKMRLIWWEPLL